jgi:hypothetical protein
MQAVSCRGWLVSRRSRNEDTVGSPLRTLDSFQLQQNVHEDGFDPIRVVGGDRLEYNMNLIRA